jgi:sulfatase maturation enzyme AslB (radical SAM superfamily)
MKIQSLSVAVPAKKCINDCAFCVSKMRAEEYPNMLEGNLAFYGLYQNDYLRRLQFARDNGCNTIMLTGNTEPQQNLPFLERFGTINNMLEKPFRWIEMQTTGVLIDEKYLRFFRDHVGISTVSVSCSSFNRDLNAQYNGTRDDLKVDLEKLCGLIKKYDFNLRISANLTDSFESVGIDNIMHYAKHMLEADQITFRKLYLSGNNTPQDDWIREHGASEEFHESIRQYIKDHGSPLERLEYGAVKYSVDGMSTVFDEDCMSTEAKEELKYLVLRPNCKLYTHWQDPASLLF